MMKSIRVKDQRWSGDFAAPMDAYDRCEPIKRPRVLLGCERDKSICSLAVPCRCCTRTSASARIMYPEDGLGHVRLMSMEQFTAAVRAL